MIAYVGNLNNLFKTFMVRALDLKGSFKYFNFRFICALLDKQGFNLVHLVGLDIIFLVLC